MNRIGAKSDSGEGGEDPARFQLRENVITSRNRAIASGRFGVTAEYLNNCQEIEIKVAQGAKPGEGGQCPLYSKSYRAASTFNTRRHIDLTATIMTSTQSRTWLN